MREPIDEGQVERAYAAVGKCLDHVEEHFRRVVHLVCNQPGVPPKGPTVSDDGLRELKAGLERLDESAKGAADLLKPLERELPGLAGEAVRSQSITASSWAEAAVMHAENYVRDRDDWMKFRKLSASGQVQLADAVTRDMPNVPLFRANLKIEEARMLQRVRPRAGQSELAVILRRMTPLPRQLLELLSERQGRWVEYSEIGERLWGDARVRDGRIHRVMERVRLELDDQEAEEFARDIRSQSGAYRFR